MERNHLGQTRTWRIYGAQSGAFLAPKQAGGPMVSLKPRPMAWVSARVCGVDEAGRGPLAGPVVAAAVVLPSMG
jgi:ribonuclease HIII